MTSQEQSLSSSTPACCLVPPTPARGLPAKFSRRGAALLNLQCWLWGQDIRRPEGNLLLQYGAHRLRPPKGIAGCSQYSFALTPGGEVRTGSDEAKSVTMLKLWGFGIYVGEPGFGCYLNRYEFVPRLVDGSDCWNAEGFRSAPRRPPLHSVPVVLRWIAAYELWVQNECGPTWRLTAAASGPDMTGTVLHLATNWCTLAHQIERWSDQQAR